MALVIHAEDLKSSGPKVDKFHTSTELMTTKRVAGNDASLMVATRPAGYHSYPHRHDCEQINYCVEGEIWIFAGEEGHLLKAGSFSRVPKGLIHWAWNRSDKPVTLVECHTPQMSFDDPERQAAIAMLFADGERPALSGQVRNIFQDGDDVHRARVEEKIFGSEG